MIMSVSNIHSGLLDFYFVSIVNYIFDYPLAVLGDIFFARSLNKPVKIKCFAVK